MPTFETRNSKSFQPRIRLRRGYGATGYPDQTDGNQRGSYPPSPSDGFRRGERCSERASKLGVFSFTSRLDHFSLRLLFGSFLAVAPKPWHRRIANSGLFRISIFGFFPFNLFDSALPPLSSPLSALSAQSAVQFSFPLSAFRSPVSGFRFPVSEILRSPSPPHYPRYPRNPRFNSPFRFPPRRAVGRFPKFFVPPVAPACHVVGRRGDRRWKTMPRRPLANAFGVASA